jgi:hypothetical protein
MSPETYAEMYRRLRAISVFRPYFEADWDVAEAKGEAAALLRFLEVRGDDVSRNAYARIKDCICVEIIHDWQDRAYRGETSEEIFDGVVASACQPLKVSVQLAASRQGCGRSPLMGPAATTSGAPDRPLNTLPDSTHPGPD